MKNVKYIVFGIFICLLLLFVLSGVLSHVYRNSSIHMKEYDKYEESIELLSNKINKVKDDDCKLALNSMLDRIKSNHLTGDVKIKDYYDSYFKDDLTFVDYYNYVASSCDLNNNKLYVNAMGTLVYPTSIKNRYNRSYEFYIKDYYFYDKEYDDVGTYTTLVNEISVLSNLLEELS